MTDFKTISLVILPIVTVLVIKVHEYLCLEHELETKRYQQRKRQSEIRKYRYSCSSNTRDLINRMYNIKDKLEFPYDSRTIKITGPVNMFQIFYVIHDTFSFDNNIRRLMRRDPNSINKSYYSDENTKHSLLTVVILNDTPLPKKRDHTKLLLTHGIKITNGDKLMANLYIFNNIPDYVKENIVLFLLSDLLGDIKLSIMKSVINMYYDEYSLLLY